MEQLPKPLLEAKIQELIEKEYPTFDGDFAKIADVYSIDIEGAMNVFERHYSQEIAATKYAKLAIEHLQKDAVQWVRLPEERPKYDTPVYICLKTRVVREAKFHRADDNFYGAGLKTHRNEVEWWIYKTLPAPPITTKQQ